MARRTQESLLNDVLNAYDVITDERKKELLQAAIKHLHAFAREVDLSRDEWMAGIDLLTAIGHTCTEERQEFILLSDLLGVSSLVELQTRKAQGAETPGSVVGPFHLANSPFIPFGGSINLDNVAGSETVHVTGTVVGIDGEPIADALLDLWQTAANEFYALQDENQSEHNLRGRQKTDKDGRFSFITTRPVPYSVPTDGPCGQILNISNRHGMRVAHIHVGIEADGYKTLITEIFDAADPRLDSDTVFGARPELLMKYKKNTDPSMDVDLVANFDFVLRRTEA